MPRCAQVYIDGSADLEFTYLIPHGLAGSIQPGSRVRVPLRKSMVPGTVLLVTDYPEYDRRLKPIDALLHERPILTTALLELARWSASYYCAPLESVLRSMLPESVRGVPEDAVKTRLAVSLVQPAGAAAIAELERRAPRQAEILTLLQNRDGPIPLAELPSPSAARALAAHGWVRIEDERVERDPHAGDIFVASEPHVLSQEQEDALRHVLQAVEQPALRRPILLQGVTGSGKTEIYLRAVDHVLRSNRTAIILVPEIALTPQTVQRFKSRFAARQRHIAVLHSHLSAGERFDEWHKIHRRDAAVVIGARSALFAPLDNVGLIIVDEEHESTYKQDTTPRYHARDLAVVRGRFEPCAVLLGSATPSLESYLNVQRRKYDLVTLRRRVDSRSLPLIRLVDMRRGGPRGGSPSILSELLRRSIRERLDRREQVLLFLNRRGFAASLQCLECGETCKCRNCSVSLTYHRADNRLVCHICGYRQIAPRRCEKCRSASVRFAGYGTERAEEVLRSLFSDARIARVDADAMRRKYTLRDTLDAFRTGRLDILVGTQMIAKGLDFPNVTLVGILNADLSLHIPDFRAAERTFQLLTQVAGRAGRGERVGEVLIQTYTPHSPAIQFARHHDYDGFATQELEFRKQFDFPPYLHAILLHVRSPNQRLAEFTTENLAVRLSNGLPGRVTLGQPLPAPIEKAASLYRFQLMIRANSARSAVQHLRTILDRMTFPKEVAVVVDVDPYSLL